MPRRTLVLGGGGPLGIAWESGLIAGLAEKGVDLSAADLILGTSAGSFVGSQLRMGRSPDSLVAAQLASDPPPRGSRPTARAAPNLLRLMELMREAATAGGAPEEARRKIGAFALAAETISEEAFIASFGSMLQSLPPDAWPERAFACTAVDAETGDFVVWTGDSGVGLARAVASSCSVPGVFPPITIRGHRYIDGGLRSGTNADLVVGSGRVVVVSVRGGTADPVLAERSRRQLEAELEVLEGAGGTVALIQPDADSLSAFGPNLMDATRRQPAAEAGLRQGRREAGRLRELWNA